MIRYLGRRLGHGILLLFGVSFLLFLLLQAAPGEFLTEIRLNAQISPETIAALRSRYGLDQPLPVRYYLWLRSMAQGEFGYSFAYNAPAVMLLRPRAFNTLLLTVPALVISWLIAVPMGVMAAARRGRWTNRLFSGGTSALLALPDVLIALVALLIALKTNLFPAGGMSSLDAQARGGWVQFVDLIWHMVLPVGALVLGSVAILLRNVRASVLDVLESTYMQAAEGHGLPQYKLLFCYALPAAANPLISLFGLSVAMLLSGSILVEVVMSWPGMGPLLLEAILSRDLFVVIDAVMLSTVLLVAGNLLADILLCMVDPRIRMRS